MRQKDIAVLILVAAISAMISFFVSGMLFGSPSDREEQVEEVQAISSSLDQADQRYFNDQAIDPTQPITIGPNANPAPFQTSDQQ